MTMLNLHARPSVDPRRVRDLRGGGGRQPTPALLAQAPGPWKPLFNGKDLTGWTVAAGRGGAAVPPAALRRADTGKLEGRGRRARWWPGQRPRQPRVERAVQGLRARARLHARRARDEVLGGVDRREAGECQRGQSCLYNSGISFRTGYQLNIGRREAGEFIGIVVHRKAPGAIRGNVLWLDSGDDRSSRACARSRTGTGCASARRVRSSPLS